MKMLPPTSLLSLLGFLALATASAHAEAVSYYDQIRPIFQANCQGCHQPAKAKGGYVMTTFEGLLEGGDTDVAITPGQPDASYLLEEITPIDGQAEMPKGKPPLASAEIALIHQWIQEGAVDDTPANAKVRYSQDNPPVYTRPPVITALDFSPDGRYLAIAGFNEVLLHHADGSGLIARLIGLSERIESVAFSPDGKRLAVTGGLPARMGEVQVWDVEKRELTLSRPVTYDTVYGASWSPQGDRIAFGGSDSTLRVIDAQSGEEVLYQGSHNDWVFDTAFSVEGTHLVSVGRDMTAKLTEIATQRFVDNITSITPNALKGGIAAVDRHPSRDEILVGGSDGVPKIYKMFRTTKRVIGDDANLLQEFPGLQGRVFSVAFSQDARRVAAGSSLDGRGEVHIYGVDPEASISEEITKILEKPTHQRNPDEEAKLQAYYDASAQTLASLPLDTGIYAVAFSPDANTLAAAGGDGVVRLFQAEGGALLKAFVPVKVQRHRNEEVTALHVDPSALELRHRHDYAQLVVTAELADGTTSDVTRDVRFSSQNLVTVSETGLARAAADGSGELEIHYAGNSLSLPLTVSGINAAFIPDYVRDVNPVISKAGCNAGTCHGAKDGKNGFKLSLRGYDPIYDLRAFTDDIAARRVNVAVPDSSLILMKATAGVPHEGGQVITPDSHAYQIIRSWIADGAGADLTSPKANQIELFPTNPVIQNIGDTQQLRVIATYPDGSRRDVTHESFTESGNTEVVEVNDAGLIHTLRRGEAAILVRYEGNYASTIVTVMGDRSGFVWEQPETFNTIDELVAAKLKRTKTLSSGLSSDTDFLRRIYIDLTGLPPSPETVSSFLQDPRETQEKRNALIDQLIGSEAFIDLWSNKWADLLLVNSKFIGTEGATTFRDWIRNEVAENTPYDDFVRKIITASGSNKANPPASYYKILRTPEDTMENTTHLFLGVRFNCNKCHDHPFERWTQDNYYEMAAFFGQVGLKKDPESGDQQIGGTAVEGGKPLYEIVFDQEEGDVIHDRTKTVAPPRFPYTATTSQPDPAESSRRQVLADWITAEDNQYFATSYVNRVWGYLTGTGLIEPLDDIRAGNPPSNPELLEWLTQSFIDSGFNTRELVRLICQSHTYQLSIETNQWNEDDHINFSHAKARRLPAEVLFDAVHAVTGSQSKIPGVPPGTRAAQLADANIKLADGFLGNLGRPARESACECERSNELQLGPIMAMVSGPTVNDAISDPENGIAKLAAQASDNRALVEALFLRVLNRPASEEEIALSLEAFEVIDDEHQQVVQALSDYQAEMAPVYAAATQAREERIAKASASLEHYRQALVAIEAQRDAEQQEKVAKLAAERQAREDALQATRTEWEDARRAETHWHTLVPAALSTSNGSLLHLQPDGSLLASGPNEKGTYHLEATTELTAITGLRIEALTDASLPQGGPGRAPDGNFVLTELSVTATPADPSAAWQALHHWTFAHDTQGWEAAHQCALASEEGLLRVTSEGQDPYLLQPNAQAEAGDFVLEFTVRSDRHLPTELYWMTADQPEAKTEQSSRITLTPSSGGAWSTHRFSFQTGSALTALRLDPGDSEGSLEIKAIRLFRGQLPATQAIALTEAQADFSQEKFTVPTAIDGKQDAKENGWAIHPQTGRRHVATFAFAEPLTGTGGHRLAIDLHQLFEGNTYNLGRFRLSVTTAPLPHHLGLPEELYLTLQRSSSERSPEEDQILFQFYREQDETWRQHQAAWEQARQPRPKDAKLVQLEQDLESAQAPLPPDPRLEELKRAVTLSTKQKENRRLTGAQDITWALINSPAFLFNR